MMFGQLEVFLAENVRGLATKPHKRDFREAIQILQEAGYAFNSVDSHCVLCDCSDYDFTVGKCSPNQVVRHRILVTEDNGIPQRRQRVFVIAIHLDSLNPQMVIDDVFPPALPWKVVFQDSRVCCWHRHINYSLNEFLNDQSVSHCSSLI